MAKEEAMHLFLIILFYSNNAINLIHILSSLILKETNLRCFTEQAKELFILNQATNMKVI